MIDPESYRAGLEASGLSDPVPAADDEAMVERVAKAAFEETFPATSWDRCYYSKGHWLAIARAALAAMREGK